MIRRKWLTVAGIVGAGAVALALSGCESDPTGTPMHLTNVRVQDPSGPSYSSTWDMTQEAFLLVDGSNYLLGQCTFKVPAEPLVAGDPTTQVLMPVETLNLNGYHSVTGGVTWPAGVSTAKVPPGTYQAKLVCSQNSDDGGTVTVHLQYPPNNLQSISPSTWGAYTDTTLTVTSSNMGSHCELLIPKDSANGTDTGQMRIPITRSGGANIAHITYDDYVGKDLQSFTHTPQQAAVSCSDREDTGTATVNIG